MQIVVNGERREVRAGATVADLLAEIGLEPRAVAVELNRLILRREALGTRHLEAGDHVEVVRFVQGGGG